MSKAFKLFTFHGQGSTFDIANISFKDITISQLYKNRFRDYCLAKQCYEPQVISLLSNLKYQDLLLQFDASNKKDMSDSAIMGHSLGELQFLSCNKLITIEDLMDISTKRNDLMIQQMNTHKDDLAVDDWISSYALLISPKVLKNTSDYIENTLIPKLDESIGQCSLSLSLHNTKNSIVLTEPLNDYIYKKLVKNKNSHTQELEIPVFSSYSNKLNYKLMDALEDFTKSSFNTIPFYKNSITLKGHIEQNKYELERYDLGPSDVLTSILNKNGL
ncbi:unnamed protein product [Hanseniaspora opuntiae]